MTPNPALPPDPWTEDPSYPMADWRAEVAARDTLRGYWDWVAAQRAPAGGAAEAAPSPAA